MLELLSVILSDTQPPENTQWARLNKQTMCWATIQVSRHIKTLKPWLNPLLNNLWIIYEIKKKTRKIFSQKHHYKSSRGKHRKTFFVDRDRFLRIQTVNIMGKCLSSDFIKVRTSANQKILLGKGIGKSRRRENICKTRILTKYLDLKFIEFLQLNNSKTTLFLKDQKF